MIYDASKYFRIWTRQLLNEFQDMTWRYNIGLQTPAIEISNSKQRLGSWHSDSRTIKISSHLILHHSWAITLNVLKHEMAHQICSEIFNSFEVAHGSSFQKACSLLGVPYEYRSAAGDLPETITHLNTETKEINEGRRFLIRVEKLLALAKSANENEASLAMQKANELIEKYNLEIWENNTTCRYRCVIINRKKKRIEGWQRKICLILRDFFFVKTIHSNLYDPLIDQTHKTIELLGTEENVTVAEYCYSFLENQLTTLWGVNRHKFSNSARTEKNSYYHGVLAGFYDTLQKQNREYSSRENTPCTNAGTSLETLSSLIVTKDHNLNAFIRMRHPRLRKISNNGPRIYRNTYDDGLATGREIVFHKGIHKKDKPNGRLITRN
jgi:hypothetical protein